MLRVATPLSPLVSCLSFHNALTLVLTITLTLTLKAYKTKNTPLKMKTLKGDST